MYDNNTDIDLRQLISVLFKNWYYVFAAALVAAVAAGLYSMSLNKQYESVALLITPENRYQVALESFVQTLDSSSAVSTETSDYTLLAMSSGVIDELSTALAMDSVKISAADLEKDVSASAQSQSSIVELSARAETPELAALITNTWAEIIVAQTSNIYSTNPEAELVRFNADLQSIEQKVDSLQSAFVEFEAGNRLRIVENQLETAELRLQSFLNRENSIALRLNDAQALNLQLDAMTQSTASMELRIMQLQLTGSSNGQTEGNSVIALSLPNPEDITVNSLELQREQVSGLISSLEAELINVSTQAAALEAPILSLQSEHADLKATQTRFVQELDQANLEMQNLIGIIAGIRLTSNGPEADSQLKLISSAIPNSEPVSPRTLVNVILAGVTAGLLAVGVLFGATWWRDDAERQSVYDSAENTIRRSHTNGQFELPHPAASSD